MEYILDTHKTLKGLHVHYCRERESTNQRLPEWT